MKTTVALVLALAFGAAQAQEKKAEEKKKTPAKSEKNNAQKTEASTTKWAKDNKIWYSKPKASEGDAKK
jgi:hypothetical protein